MGAEPFHDRRHRTLCGRPPGSAVRRRFVPGAHLAQRAAALLLHRRLVHMRPHPRHNRPERPVAHCPLLTLLSSDAVPEARANATQRAAAILLHAVQADVRPHRRHDRAQRTLHGMRFQPTRVFTREVERHQRAAALLLHRANASVRPHAADHYLERRRARTPRLPRLAARVGCRVDGRDRATPPRL